MAEQPSIGVLEEFRIEFLDCWRRLPNKVFFLVLLLGWLGLFHFIGNSTQGYAPTPSLIGWMYRVYNPPGVEESGEIGGYIPLVVLGLLWWRRKELLAVELRAWSPALALVGLGLGLHIVGYLAQQPVISILGLLTGLYGLTGLAWGPDWLRASFFPFFLFAFMVPPGSAVLPVTFQLRLWVCQIVEGVCGNLLSIDIIREGTALSDPSHKFQYEVAAACSGIRSLTATVLVALIYGWLSFPQWWKRGLILASAFPFAVLGNVLRMLAIVIAADIGGQEAGNKVHDGGPFGIYSLLPYVPAFAGLLLLGYWLRERKPSAQAGAEGKTV